MHAIVTPFASYSSDKIPLQAKETLAEIPDQFLSYMKTHGIKPNPPPLRKQVTMAECLSPGLTSE